MHNMTWIRHGKNGVTQCNEMTILTDSFVPLPALLFWLGIEVVDACFVLNNELCYKLAGTRRYLFRSSSETCVHFGVSIFNTHLTDTVHTNAQDIYSSKVILCMSCSSLATIRSKYYFNFILNRTRSGRELFDRPSYKFQEKFSV